MCPLHSCSLWPQPLLGIGNPGSHREVTSSEGHAGHVAALASVLFPGKASVLGVRGEARKDTVEPFSAHAPCSPHSIFLCIVPRSFLAKNNRESGKCSPKDAEGLYEGSDALPSHPTSNSLKD